MFLHLQYICCFTLHKTILYLIKLTFIKLCWTHWISFQFSNHSWDKISLSLSKLGSKTLSKSLSFRTWSSSIKSFPLKTDKTKNGNTVPRLSIMLSLKMSVNITDSRVPRLRLQWDIDKSKDSLVTFDTSGSESLRRFRVSCQMESNLVSSSKYRI